MRKKMMFLAAFAAAAFTVPALAQFTPSGGSSPHSVVAKLERENFRNIKLMYVSIMNYGGGEAEFNRLISGYAEATSKYYSKEFDGAAAAFKKNEKDINDTGMMMAAKYKERAVKLHQMVIELNVKLSIKNSLENKENVLGLEKLVHEASESLAKGNDLFVRKKPAEAIDLYRRAKERCIQFHEAVKVALPEDYDRDKKDNAGAIFVSKEKEN